MSYGALKALAEKEEKEYKVDYVVVPGNNHRVEKDAIRCLIFYSFIKILGKHEAILAGGALTSLFTKTRIADMDIFFPGQAKVDACLKELQEDSKRSDFDFIRNSGEQSKDITTHESKNSTNVYYDLETTGYDEANILLENVGIDGTASVKLQLVKPSVMSGNAQEVLTTFDFTACMAAYDFAADEFIFHPDFFSHLASKKLHYNEHCDRNHINSLMRSVKYKEKGYDLSVLQLLKMCLSIQDKYETFADALKAMTYTNRQLRLFKKLAAHRELLKLPFTFDNLIHILEETNMERY